MRVEGSCYLTIHFPLDERLAELNSHVHSVSLLETIALEFVGSPDVTRFRPIGRRSLIRVSVFEGLVLINNTDQDGIIFGLDDVELEMKLFPRDHCFHEQLSLLFVFSVVVNELILYYKFFDIW